MPKESADRLDFFSGGIPAGPIFQLHVSEINKLLLSKPKRAIGRTLEEICFIGLVSFFEAFCRDCFASLINICPTLIERLRDKYDMSIDSLQAVEMASSLRQNVGFLVCERIDFGNARKINALYSALIKITPFSKDEIAKFDQTLSDRNLLVHNGGIYNHSFLRQKIISKHEQSRPHFDSLVVDHHYISEKSTFLSEIAEKTLKASHAAMNKQIACGDLVVDEVARGALELFDWWDVEQES